MSEVEGALNANDFTAVSKFLLPTSMVIFQDTTIARGPAEIEAYYNRMLGETSSVLSSISVTADVGGPATFLDDDTAIAHGNTVDTFEFRTGNTMRLRTAWSTTVRRQNGRWYIASLHFSNNLFDNPIVNGAKRMTWIAASAAFLIGLLLMWIVGRVRRSK